MTFSTFRTALPAAALVLTAGLLAGCSDSSTASSPGASASASASSSAPAEQGAAAQKRAEQALAQLEERFDARLGFYLLDTGTGREITHRADERFSYASTFKALAAGVLLGTSTDEELDRVVRYDESDLLEYAPVTSEHVDTGMTLDALIAAAVQYSDNTAANLMLEELDGPEGLQKALRDLGDTTTSVDRIEPDLNGFAPGDDRDTSSPRALGTDLRRFVLGDALPEDRRERLTDLLLGNTTGDDYIRAGVPDGWRVGDKTGGGGGHGTRNDIAVVWPDSGAPLVLAIVSDRGEEGAASDDALLAEATEAGLAALR